ncbi:dipeptidase [Azorhizobium caulinodans]|uniref:dipeptidase n=1 Tax=Azorhizobium caulinodans TaxID=7 RepID=UPI002FBD3AF8
MSTLHDSLIVIDGLIISDFSRPVFEDMRKGGLTAANCTCSVWENFTETMRNIAKWKADFRTHADLITQVYTSEDILLAKAENKTGIILGWQNTSAIEDRIEYLPLFHELGIRIIQMTYNTQNWVGSGCYESRDSGLSDFGHDVVAEMNRLGILCDLSHVGPKTSEDVIKASKQRVAYSHCLPSGLKEHKRNKSDEQLRFIAEKGGFVGVTMFPPFLKKGPAATVADYVEAMEYVINLVGEDIVGVGTDFTQGYGQPFFDWITHDKGFGRKLTDFGAVINPEGFREIGDFPNLTAAMEQRGWSTGRIEKVMGGNWLQLLKDVWGR